MKIHESLSALELIALDEPHRFNFLELHRLHIRNHYPDGSTSKAYTYEASLRKHLDAVAVLLFEKSPNRMTTRIFLRRTLRPALALRDLRNHPVQSVPQILKLDEKPILLEVVAGIMEAEDRGEEGIHRRAVAEIWEESGFRAQAKDLIPLGHSILPTPGMNPEAIHLFACAIDPSKQDNPPGDGSPTEEVGGIVPFTLPQALAACRSGEIRDAKTEICLHRFWHHLG